MLLQNLTSNFEYFRLRVGNSEIDSEKEMTNRYSMEKLERFRNRYSTKKVKNNEYAVSVRFIITS